MSNGIVELIEATSCEHCGAPTVEKVDKTIRETLLKFWDEIHEGTKEAAQEIEGNTATLQRLRARIDRWQAMSSSAAQIEFKLTRRLMDAESAFQQKFNTKASRPSSLGTLHYEERKAKYTEACLTEWLALERAKKLTAELKQFGYYVRSQLQWLEGKRREVEYLERKQLFTPGSDYNSLA